jgi:hypothetical protein
MKNDYTQRLVIPIERSANGRYRCQIYEDFSSFKRGQFELKWMTFSPDELVILTDVEKEFILARDR